MSAPRCCWWATPTLSNRFPFGFTQVYSQAVDKFADNQAGLWITVGHSPAIPYMLLIVTVAERIYQDDEYSKSQSLGMVSNLSIVSAV